MNISLCIPLLQLHNQYKIVISAGYIYKSRTCLFNSKDNSDSVMLIGYTMLRSEHMQGGGQALQEALQTNPEAGRGSVHSGGQ